ncbi:MAG: aldo/keto reductase [Candidatus Omnitrophica bacterium]|nr:aldo/keto reductase [Candidatus Omnitrophota bacterium]
MIIGLGTAQFGLDYGVSNTNGRLPRDEISRILDRAGCVPSIQVIDTAPAYGESEKILGEFLVSGDRFRIISKTRHFRKKALDLHDADLLERDLDRSLNKLKQASIYGLLVHSADDLLAQNGTLLFKRMQQLREAGFIKKIGVSVYAASQTVSILEQFEIDLIELPFNLLDQQFMRNKLLEQMKARGIEIFVRSIFLQGLLLMEPGQVDDYFALLKPLLAKYHAELRNYGLTPLEGAIQFLLKYQDLFDCALVGVCSESQLNQIIEATKQMKAPSFPYESFACDVPQMINPSLWSLTEIGSR